MIKYESPNKWVLYDTNALLEELVNAKAAITSLKAMPYQKSWADKLQNVQLKREIAGTSRIEGADFTEKELDDALNETPEQLHTRSQRQAYAAKRAYCWIANLDNKRPITSDLICEIHRLIITGADDDHCPPGIIRKHNENILFGSPKHRGVEGGDECKKIFNSFCNAIQSEFRDHDLLIQALAAHYHFAAMHPFLDGSGRTARAMEALLLQRIGLKDTLFIAMSNYYYEEKNEYLKVLSLVRQRNNDLTPFIKFGLCGVAIQCNRLFDEIKINLSKALFRNMMFSLFNRLQTKRKRVMQDRQLEILKILLEKKYELNELVERSTIIYKDLQNPHKTFVRDINYLFKIKAIGHEKRNGNHILFVRLEWPTEITETKFFESIKQLPKAKSLGFLS